MTSEEKTTDHAIASVTVKPRSALPLWSRDPWLYSGAVASVTGCPSAGDLVEVRDSDGRFIGRGHYAPGSRIAVRLVSWREDDVVDDDFWRARLAGAFELRHRALGLGGVGGTDAYRLVHGEGDGIPGLIVDRIGSVVTVQAGTAFALGLRDLLREVVASAFAGATLVERHDAEALTREGVPLADTQPQLDAEPETEVVREGAVCLVASPRSGQKTGFYTDQRCNRMLLGAMASSRRVADLFCYSGGFSLHAAAAGATSVTGVDTSRRALEMAWAGAALAVADGAVRPNFVEADAITWASEQAAAGERFDLVIADPPRLVRTRSGLKRGLARYRRIFQSAISLAAPGGLVALFSCSGLVAEEEMHGAVIASLRERGRTGSVLQRLAAGSDHPFRLRAGGGEYLKGVLLRLLD